jgi:hypothetical protein
MARVAGFLLLFLSLVSLAACALDMYRAYPGPARTGRRGLSSEVGWVENTPRVTVTEIDGVTTAGIRNYFIELLPGKHSLTATIAWGFPSGVYQAGGSPARFEATNRLYFEISGGQYLAIRTEDTAFRDVQPIGVGYNPKVRLVTGRRICLATLKGAEVSRYKP